MRVMEAVARLTPAAMFACWCGTAHACRPFDGTDAAGGDTGEIEFELSPVEYLRAGADRVLLALDLKVNYGFAQDKEVTIRR